MRVAIFLWLCHLHCKFRPHEKLKNTTQSCEMANFVVYFTIGTKLRTWRHMDFKNFTDLGNDIGKRVNAAIYSMNFDQLSRDVRRKVDQAFSGSSDPVYGNGGIDGNLYHGDDERTRNDPLNFKLYREDREETAPRPMPSMEKGKKGPGKAGGIAMMVIGYILAIVFGSAAISMGILGATMTSIGTIPAAALGAGSGGMAIPFLAGLVLAVAGTKRCGLVNRFRKYDAVIDGNAFCAIKDLAASIGKSPRFVAKDLEKMIRRGFFPEGHIDDHRTCLIRTEAMYQQYVQARDSAAQAAQAGRAAEAQSQAQPDGFAGKQEDHLEQVIQEGEEYIRTIREANDAIYDQEISEKLYRMERIVRKIFDYVRQKPEQVDQLRRFMDYYMPTTEKLVVAYRQLDEQSIQGENMAKAKGEIAQTLDTINEAYEKMYDSMYVDVAMDVSSDIAVLKTLFAQEGLTEDDWMEGKHE